MKINFEKKHLYIISGVILLLFSSLYVIAQTSFTSPAWTAEKQSHGVLYTDIITSKSTTDPNRKVTVEAELDAKGGISLGGIKRTTWPTETGSSTGGGRECYTVQRARTEYGIYDYERLHWLCNSPDRSFQSLDTVQPPFSMIGAMLKREVVQYPYSTLQTHRTVVLIGQSFICMARF